MRSEDGWERILLLGTPGHDVSWVSFFLANFFVSLPPLYCSFLNEHVKGEEMLCKRESKRHLKSNQRQQAPAERQN